MLLTGPLSSVDEVFSRSLMLSNSTTPLLTVVVGLLLVCALAGTLYCHAVC